MKDDNTDLIQPTMVSGEITAFLTTIHKSVIASLNGSNLDLLLKKSALDSVISYSTTLKSFPSVKSAAVWFRKTLKDTVKEFSAGQLMILLPHFLPWMVFPNCLLFSHKKFRSLCVETCTWPSPKHLRFGNICPREQTISLQTLTKCLLQLLLLLLELLHRIWQFIHTHNASRIMILSSELLVLKCFFFWFIFI